MKTLSTQDRGDVTRTYKLFLRVLREWNIYFNWRTNKKLGDLTILGREDLILLLPHNLQLGRWGGGGVMNQEIQLSKRTPIRPFRKECIPASLYMR